MVQKFGGIKVKSNFFLAPMAAVSSLPFRVMCKQMGAGLVFTEQVNATQISKKPELFTKNKIFSIKTCKEEKPVVVQLFGTEPKDFAIATKIVEKRFEMINLNCGCPAKKEVEIGAGAALLKEPKKIVEIIKSIKSVSTKPVTVKIRLGWSKNEGVKIAKMIEKAGADALIVHGRTAEQGYSGKANWKAIKKIQEAIEIPVVANGDIVDAKSAMEILEKTNCEFGMIGRTAMTNPFIFKEIIEFEKGKEWFPTSKEKINAFFDYYALCEKFEMIKLSDLKLKAMNFTKGIEGIKKRRTELLKSKTIEEIKKVLGEVK